MQESVQIRKLNRDSSHDKGGTLRGCAHCLGTAWPGLTRGTPPWFRAPDTPG